MSTTTRTRHTIGYHDDDVIGEIDQEKLCAGCIDGQIAKDDSTMRSDGTCAGVGSVYGCR